MKKILVAFLLAGTMVMSSAPVVADHHWYLIEARDHGDRDASRVIQVRDRGDRRGVRRDRRGWRGDRGYRRGWRGRRRGWRRGRRYPRYYRDCDVSLGPFCVNL